MEFRKTIILLMLGIFLLSITSVCASEIDTPIASEDTSQIGLSDIDKVDDDNPQTSEEKLELGVDESLNEQTDTDVLGDSSATYSDLATEISESGNVVLKYKNYTYDDGASAITVREANKVIDGNGAVIDMAGSAIRAFTVYASDVTIKNLTIKNVNYNGYGGAIYFSSTGTVTNCNFTNNEAYDGGAVYFVDKGTVENCNFTDNSATYGGAVVFSDVGNVTNCKSRRPSG
ncbi:right-handed parallel beta-helix repeat-containing protein, partial [Methanobrevibacter sp.]